MYRLRFSPLDALLLLLTVIWGANFTVVKVAVRDIPEIAFNALRLSIAAVAYLVMLWWREGAPRFTSREWWKLLELAVVGNVIYQLFFLGAVARTSVANTSLIFAFTPVMVAMLTSILGHERVSGGQWAGAVVSLAGIAFVVGEADAVGATLTGDLLAIGAMACWALYTAASRPLLARHSPMSVTGYSMSMGAAIYLPLAWNGFRMMEWGSVPARAWAATVASGLLALFVSYLIWYTAVQRLGGTRTAIYSNLTPFVAMAVAATAIGEPFTLRKLAGAVAVLAGVAIAKVEREPHAPEA